MAKVSSNTSMSPWLQDFARLAPLTRTGVEALLDWGVIEDVVDNQYVADCGLIDDDRWVQLFKGSSADLAIALLSRPLSEPMARAALQDKRVRVLQQLVAKYPVPVTDLLALRGRPGEKACQAALESRALPASHWRDISVADMARVAARAGGVDALKWAAHLPPQERRQLVASAMDQLVNCSARKRYRISTLLRELVSLFPDLVDIAFESGPVAVAAVAGTMGIVDVKTQSSMLDSLVEYGHRTSSPTEASRIQRLRMLGLLRFISAPHTEVTLLNGITKQVRDDKVVKAVHNRLTGKHCYTVRTAFQDVTDTATLEWLIKRASPFQSRSWTVPAKRNELFALCLNDAVRHDGPLAHRLEAAIRSAYREGDLSSLQRDAAISALSGNLEVTLEFMLTAETCLTPAAVAEVLYSRDDPQHPEKAPTFTPTQATSKTDRSVSRPTGPVVDTLLDTPRDVLWQTFLEVRHEASLAGLSSYGEVTGMMDSWLIDEMVNAGLDTPAAWSALVNLLNSSPSSTRDTVELLKVL